MITFLSQNERHPSFSNKHGHSSTVLSRSRPAPIAISVDRCRRPRSAEPLDYQFVYCSFAYQRACLKQGDSPVLQQSDNSTLVGYLPSPKKLASPRLREAQFCFWENTSTLSLSLYAS